jgi:hypothetical protein
MALRLKKCIKVPEGAFDIPISRHFFKSHCKKNLFKLFSDLKKRMEMAPSTRDTFSIEIIGFKFQILPGSRT